MNSDVQCIGCNVSGNTVPLIRHPLYCCSLNLSYYKEGTKLSGNGSRLQFTDLYKVIKENDKH